MEENNINKIIANKYLKVYNAINNKYNDNTNYKDIYSYINDLQTNHYTAKGRVLTEDEIVMYEIYKIKKYMITDDFKNNKNEKYIKCLYRILFKSKIKYDEKEFNYFQSIINEIYCLLGLTPPFLDEVYKVCSLVEAKGKIKNLNKGD